MRKVTDAEEIAAAFAPRVAAPLFLTPFETGMAFYRQWLGMTARLLEDQSAYLHDLAACDTPFAMLACQKAFSEEYVRTGLAALRGAGEGDDDR